MTKPPETLIDMECPRCGGKTQVKASWATKRIRCTDCLMERVEVVTLVPATEK